MIAEFMCLKSKKKASPVSSYYQEESSVDGECVDMYSKEVIMFVLSLINKKGPNLTSVIDHLIACSDSNI